MNFKELLEDAKINESSTERLIEIYKPMLTKSAIIDGVFDEDLYQENILILLGCIRSFRI